MSAADLRTIDLIIGYGAIIGQQQDMYFNLHLIMNKYEWEEKITYSNLLKLKYSIDFEYYHGISASTKANLSTEMSKFYEFHKQFATNELNEQFLNHYLSLFLDDHTADIFIQKEMPFLKQFLSNLETWLLYLLNHINQFSKEIQNFLQQFFFTSLISLSCFRILTKSKEELDILLEDIQSIRSIVLEKAAAAASAGGMIAGMMVNKEHESSSESLSEKDVTMTTSFKLVPNAPLPTYNPQEHLTVVAEPNYQVENYEWFTNPSLAEVITLPAPAASANSANNNNNILQMKGQPLANNSPLAKKLAMLRSASQKISQSRNTIAANAPPPPSSSTPSKVTAVNTGDTYSLIQSTPNEVLRIIEMLQSVEGIACDFFIPLTDRQPAKPCPGKLFIKNYLPSSTTNVTSIKKYDPTTAILEIHLNSFELQINVILTFNLLNEIDQAKQGIGSTVILPKDQAISSCFHVIIKDKPEALLSISDVQQFTTFIDHQPSLSDFAKKLPSHFVMFTVQALNNIFEEVARLHKQKQADSITTMNSMLSKSVVTAGRGSITGGVTGAAPPPFPTEEEKTTRESSTMASFNIFSRERKTLNQKIPNDVAIFDIQEKLENYDRKLHQTSFNTKQSVTGVLKDLKDPTVITIQSYYWVNVVESRWFQNMKPRLLLMKSDRMIDVYKIPNNHNTMLSLKQSSNTAEHGIVISNRQGVNKRLEQFKRSKFMPSVLSDLGFVFEKNYSIDAIKCDEDGEEEKEVHSICISVAGSAKILYFENEEGRKLFLSKLPRAKR